MHVLKTRRLGPFDSGLCRRFAGVLLFVLGCSGRAVAGDEPPREMAAPVAEGPFIRPAATHPATPRWGHVRGLQISIWPTPGPRGLIRIHAPHAGSPDRVFNFVAIEPIVAGRRGYSELEPSRLDPGQNGKAMWSVQPGTPSAGALPPWQPARGLHERVDQVEELAVDFVVEPFANGSIARIRARFFSDRPQEVQFTVHDEPGSAVMEACVLTATMGNYARLRRLHLRDRVVTPATLWPEWKPDDWGFALPRSIPVDQMLATSGEVMIAATPDETDPARAEYDPGTKAWWRFEGSVATQYWRASPDPALVARVNARKTYWMSPHAIPGGPAFENLELIKPFRAGQAFTFGIALESPRQLGFPGVEP